MEHVTSSGLGLTIGSIASNVRNITFRNIYMPHTYKGIYMKFRGAGSVRDVLYEDRSRGGRLLSQHGRESHRAAECE